MGTVPIEHYKKLIREKKIENGRVFNTKKILAGYYVFSLRIKRPPGAETGLPLFIVCNSKVEEEPLIMSAPGFRLLEYELSKRLEDASKTK